jgi:hypothetical protein
MWVAHVMSEYPEELEADLLQFFGVDLLDVWRNKVSLRRVLVLSKRLMHMHGQAALPMAYDESLSWGTQEHLMARVTDALEVSNWMFIQANSGEGAGEVPFPDPVPRPGDVLPEEEPKKLASTGEVASFLNNIHSML